MWLLVHQLSLHSLGTKMSFRLLHSPLMASFSFQARMTKQFERGMQQLAPQSVNLFEAIQITSIALHSPATARSLHRARMTRQFNYGIHRRLWRSANHFKDIFKVSHVSHFPPTVPR